MMQIAGAARVAATRGLFLCGAALTAFGLPSVAQAQDAAVQAVDNDATENTGNAIVVTATKREKTLQDVPVAVTVTTAETLERAQIRDLRDLQTVVPSLTVGQRANVGSTNFFIRGFGNGANNAGIEPSVGVFVDNVYRSRTLAQITDLPDVSRIEVLRGPQSTLFGKNASAGIVSITTKEPQFKLGGSAELTYGAFNQVIARGYLTGPIEDNLAASITAGINKRDGFFEDRGTGGRTNERDRWFVRGQLLGEMGDVRVRVIADYDAIDENCCAVLNLRNGIATPAVLAVGGMVNDPANWDQDVVYNNFNSTNEVKNYGISAQLDWDIGDFKLTSISAFRNTRAVTYQDSDFTSADLLYPNFQDLHIGTLTQELRLSGSIGDRVDVLLGAFYIDEDIDQRNNLNFATDFRSYANLLVQGLSSGALSLPMLESVFGAADQTNYTGQFLANGQGFSEFYTLDSQALSVYGQFDVTLFDGVVLTLGGNYTDDRKTYSARLNSTDVFSSINLDAPQYAGFRGQLLTQGAVAQGVGTALNLGRAATAAEVQAFAGSNATAFQTIFAGARAYATANANNPLANPLAQLRQLQLMPPFLDVPNAVEDGHRNDSKFTYTARLAADVSEWLNVYASYATGFKASSINLSRDSRPSPSDRAAIEAAGLSSNNLVYGSRLAAPEEATVIELGAKANWRWISANLAIFQQDIDGFQSNVFTGSGFALRNAGKLRTRGVEFESQARLGGLQLNLGATYLDPVYKSFPQSAVGDLSGRRPADIPEWSLIVGAQYELAVGNGNLVPRVSYLWQSDVQIVEGMPGYLVKNPDGTIADASLALAAALPFRREVNDLTASIAYEFDNGLALSIWGRNLLNDRNFSTVFDAPAQPRGISGYLNDPRTYGASVRYRF
ncbi:TonB-dependent receptor [Altererythrobacter xixiisoli]|uniref:TonB-dependent receptor n=1 Tax=Croceibacterium xixiisoli TaxID=1476466 RepID=A0A6I4TQT2_9SPHN|nr:TonB-dependent receptor [Croceibacterium xixiisoli]MXO98246.1 TonB-dependent receptor [Croceibacterium xixiisoli]